MEEKNYRNILSPIKPTAMKVISVFLYVFIIAYFVYIFLSISNFKSVLYSYYNYRSFGYGIWSRHMWSIFGRWSILSALASAATIVTIVFQPYWKALLPLIIFIPIISIGMTPSDSGMGGIIVLPIIAIVMTALYSFFGYLLRAILRIKMVRLIILILIIPLLFFGYKSLSGIITSLNPPISICKHFDKNCIRYSLEIDKSQGCDIYPIDDRHYCLATLAVVSGDYSMCNTIKYPGSGDPEKNWVVSSWLVGCYEEVAMTKLNIARDPAEIMSKSCDKIEENLEQKKDCLENVFLGKKH